VTGPSEGPRGRVAARVDRWHLVDTKRSLRRRRGGPSATGACAPCS
jgi:hypothetical protein